MKAIMISIQPQWVEKILNGEKTIEIRKTMPKCELPCKVYIYETKSKYKKGFYNNLDHKVHYCEYFGKGKVVAEFTLNKVEPFSVGSWKCDDIQKLACLSYEEIINYFYKPEELDGSHLKWGYAWHIDNLKIYDKPKHLQEFFKPCDGCEKLNTSRCANEISDCRAKTLKRPPQSWCYCQGEDDCE